MEELVNGIHHFQKQVFSTKRQLFENLKDGQAPQALFITCSDSRINPNLLTQTEPGELFILRNAGNLIPPYGAGQGGEAGTIEYAVSALGVKDIVVCGHSHCGAMTAILHPEKLDRLPAVRSWMAHAETTRRIVEENYQHLHGDNARLMATIEENVLVQLENLRTHPSVAAAIGRNQLNLHAWVYEFETGTVYCFDHDTEQFAPLQSREDRFRRVPPEASI